MPSEQFRFDGSTAASSSDLRMSPRRRRRHRTRRCRDFHHPLSADVACSILGGGAFVQLVRSCGTDAFGHAAFVVTHGIGAETSKIETTHEARWIDSISLCLSLSLSLCLCIYIYTATNLSTLFLLLRALHYPRTFKSY